MESLIKKQSVDKNLLDGAGYFRALLSYAGVSGLLFEEEILFIQEQLWTLTGRQTTKYTMGDSSSVPLEAAQELLLSVCYTIGLYLKGFACENDAIGQLKSKSVDILFRAGQEQIKQSVEQGKKALLKLQSGRIRTKNIAYNDTIAKLPVFFRDYDMRFFAHEPPGDIDYPLCIPVPEFGGIEYIGAYMKRLGIEDAFCRKFDPGNIERLLAGYCRDSVNLLVNIFEPVFFNALGLALLDTDIFKLNITPAGRDYLLSMLKNQSLHDLARRLSEALQKICTRLDMENCVAHAYFEEVQKLFLCRLKEQITIGDLSALFVSFKETPAERKYAVYEDGKQMPDEALRDLIAKMQSAGTTQYKTELVKSCVHSLNDLMEVLNECFEDGEYAYVFELFTDMELSELLKKLYIQKGDALYNRNGNAQWADAFLDYLGGMDKVRFEMLLQSIQNI